MTDAVSSAIIKPEGNRKPQKNKTAERQKDEVVAMTDYGTTSFEGKKYTLTQDAYYSAGTEMYQASAEDEEGNIYMAYFGILEGHEDDEFEDTMCDWDYATNIEKIW